MTDRSRAVLGDGSRMTKATKKAARVGPSVPRVVPTGTTAERQRGNAQSAARTELEAWIDSELEVYVKGMINDGDYAKLRTDLIDIAEAHANNRLVTRGSHVR
jgi:hypothetical protein